MSKLRVNAFSVSLDGYGAGPDQSLDYPLGVGGLVLHDWIFSPRTVQREVMHNEDSETGIGDDFSARARLPTWAHGFWGATCSAQAAGRGRMMVGKAGGGITHPIMYRSLCLRTTRAQRVLHRV